MRFPRLLFLLPYAVLTVVGACLFAAARIAVAVPDEQRLQVVLAAFWAGLAVVAGAAVIAARASTSWKRACRLAFTPSLLFASGYGMFLLVERDLTRAVVALVILGLLGAFFLSLEGMGGVTPRYSAQDLAHLAFVLHVVACFFAFGFLFALPSVSTVHPAFMALAMTLLVGAVAYETLWHEGFSHQRAWPVALAFAALGGEFFVALSFLPILPFVCAAVALTLLVPALTTSVLALKGAKPPYGPIALAAALALLVLASARWN
jgi:hypothetical protein